MPNMMTAPITASSSPMSMGFIVQRCTSVDVMTASQSMNNFFLLVSSLQRSGTPDQRSHLVF
jgi:hypothetical protein